MIHVRLPANSMRIKYQPTTNATTKTTGVVTDMNCASTYRVLLKKENQFHLVRKDTVYTKFKESLVKVAEPLPGKMQDFVDVLQKKLDGLQINDERNAPDAPTLDQLL